MQKKYVANHELDNALRKEYGILVLNLSQLNLETRHCLHVGWKP